MFTLYCYARVAAKLLSVLIIVCAVCGAWLAIQPPQTAENMIAAAQAIEEYHKSCPEAGRTPCYLLDAYDRAMAEAWHAAHPGKALPIHMMQTPGVRLSSAAKG